MVEIHILQVNSPTSKAASVKTQTQKTFRVPYLSSHDISRVTPAFIAADYCRRFSRRCKGHKDNSARQICCPFWFLSVYYKRHGLVGQLGGRIRRLALPSPTKATFRPAQLIFRGERPAATAAATARRGSTPSGTPHKSPQRRALNHD